MISGNVARRAPKVKASCPRDGDGAVAERGRRPSMGRAGVATYVLTMGCGQNKSYWEIAGSLL